MVDFIYDSAQVHVEKRNCIADPLRAAMFELPREKWHAHPRMGGEAAFWLQIHEGLLGASSTLADWAQQFLGLDDVETMALAAPRLRRLGVDLTHHAHGHHHIEDHHFFPAFLRMFPQLQHPLEMLDGDHKVLGEVLHDLETALASFPAAASGSDRERREAWRNSAGLLLPAAQRLDRLFIRHIGDEEEICIPAMLR